MFCYLITHSLIENTKKHLWKDKKLNSDTKNNTILIKFFFLVQNFYSKSEQQLCLNSELGRQSLLFIACEKFWLENMDYFKTILLLQKRDLCIL